MYKRIPNIGKIQIYRSFDNWFKVHYPENGYNSRRINEHKRIVEFELISGLTDEVELDELKHYQKARTEKKKVIGLGDIYEEVIGGFIVFVLFMGVSRMFIEIFIERGFLSNFTSSGVGFLALLYTLKRIRQSGG